MKGQSDLISAVVLVSVVLVMSVGFLGYASSLLSQKTAESDLNNLLQKEVANTVIYKELAMSNGTVFLGVVRVDGSRSTYHYLVVSGMGETYCSSGLIGGGEVLTNEVPASPSIVYVLTMDGQYVPLNTFTPFRNGGSVRLNRLPHEGVNELLKVTPSGGSGACWVVIFFTQANNNYYEVGRYYELKS